VTTTKNIFETTPEVTENAPIKNSSEIFEAREQSETVGASNAIPSDQTAPGLFDPILDVVTYPYHHPIASLFIVGMLGAIVASTLIERRTGINVADRIHSLANPYCACHRCNPKFRQQNYEARDSRLESKSSSDSNLLK